MNCQLMMKLEIMHVLQAQGVRLCINSHPGLLYQKTKWTTSDASKSQVNQASWNRAVWKFGSEKQLNVQNYLSIFICDFPLIARFGKNHVTISLIGCAPHTYSIGHWYWRMWELLAFECV